LIAGHCTLWQADAGRRFFRDLILGTGRSIRSSLANLDAVSSGARGDGASAARQRAYRSFTDARAALDGRTDPSNVPTAPSNLLLAFVGDDINLPGIAALLGVARETSRARVVSSLATLARHYANHQAPSIPA